MSNSEGVLCIPQNSSITEASPSDSLMSYLGHSLEESYPSTNKWLTLNQIVRNRTLWQFNCVQTNDWCLIELLVIDSNTWSNLTVKWWMNNKIFGTIQLCANILALAHLKIRLHTNYWLTNNMYNYWTVCKQMSSGSFKNVIYKLCIDKSYMYRGFGIEELTIVDMPQNPNSSIRSNT